MMNGPLAGFASSVWRVLRAPRTPVVLVALWAAGAALGGLAPLGAHPAESVLLHIPAALLPFALMARAATLAERLLAVGVGLALLGAAQSGAELGEVRVGGVEPPEAYTAMLAGRQVPVALGGQLTARTDDAESLSLRLGTPKFEVASTQLPSSGEREVSLGPWRVHARGQRPNDAPSRLRGVARGPNGERIALDLRAGETLPLADGVTLTLEGLEADYGRRLGAAARVSLDTNGQRRTDWVFLDAPDLDQRLAPGQWTIEPTSISADSSWVLGVRRSGIQWLAALGLALAAAALVAQRRVKEPT